MDCGCNGGSDIGRGEPGSPGLVDLGPARESMLDEVLEGLRCPEKFIPCKFLYDENGSRLFDRICELDEYYLTRTELSVLREYREAIGELLGPRCLLVEYGSGSSLKTRVLLDQLEDLAGYVPIDISREHLLASCERLRERYPGLRVVPVCADYTADFELPLLDLGEAQRVVFFPGSTIGNFEPDEARVFLKRAASVCQSGGGVLIGVDLHKDSDVLQAAYADSQGISAEFALNVLHRLNWELGADFRVDRFGYDAFYDRSRQRIVMSLLSLEDQEVRIAGESISFDEGERILTEYSYKYTPESFAELAAGAGLRVARIWTDPARLFSVQYLRAD